MRVGAIASVQASLIHVIVECAIDISFGGAIVPIQSSYWNGGNE